MEKVNVPKDFRDQFVDVLVDYAEANTEETNLLALTKPHPRVSPYLAWRKKSSGGRFGPLLAELAHGVFLPPAWRAHPLMIRFAELSNLISSYQNDYVSFRCGMDTGRLNLVFALETEVSISQGRALEYVLQFHDSTVLEYHELVQELATLAQEDPIVLRYLQVSKQVLIGSTRYHELSARFQ